MFLDTSVLLAACRSAKGGSRFEDTYVIDQPVVFDATKDRPVLLTACKHSDVLLTLDRRDFLRTIGSRFYHLEILTPEQFIRRQRQHGIIKVP